ncbi:MAG: hypothetical protein R3B54_00080 [Bdellovibrionota bacterium]
MKLVMATVMLSLLITPTRPARAVEVDPILCAYTAASAAIGGVGFLLGRLSRRTRSERSPKANVELTPEEILGENMFTHAIQIKPRFSDFNMQGILKGSLHFDFVCETQLAQLNSRYGINFSKYREANQKWNISDYRITFHEENKSLEPFWVVADVVKVEGSTKLVAFSFWSNNKQVKYASGTIQFDLYDTKDNRFVPIPTDDAEAFRSAIREGEE